jgi:hypothetical protein
MEPFKPLRRALRSFGNNGFFSALSQAWGNSVSDQVSKPAISIADSAVHNNTCPKHTACQNK